jgi:hypothetical protein
LFVSLFQLHFLNSLFVTGQEEDSEEDEDFSGSGGDDEDEELGSVDTDIEEEEVEDLQADLETMPTTRKSTTPKKTTPKKDAVKDVSAKMSQLTVESKVKESNIKYISLEWRFPMAMYSVMEDDTKKIYIDLMKGVQLPSKYILHAKVLPGGKQFSLLVAVPRWMFEETYMKARFGANFTTTSALYQAFDRYIIQPIRRMFPDASEYVEGTPQIVDLDEECVEGPVPYVFGNARTKGTEKVNGARQYQKTMTFQLTAVKKKIVKAAKPKTVFFGSMNASDSESSESEEEEKQQGMSDDE